MWAVTGDGGWRRRLPVLFAEDAGGFGFVLELEVGFFEGHVDGEAGGEAAVGVDAEAGGVDVLDGLFDAGDDLFYLPYPTVTSTLSLRPTS